MQNDIVLDLLTIETSSVLYVPSITTITFFDGFYPLEYIHERLTMILKLNPWLTGKLIKKNDKIKLLYNESKVYDINKYFFKRNDMISYPIENMDEYNHLMDKINYLFVKPGYKCIETDESLFKCIIIHNDLTNKFAFLLSLSHIIGDGYTYYKLYNMFSSQFTPFPMTVKRYLEFDQIILENKYKWYSSLGMKLHKFLNSFFKIPIKPFKLVVLNNKDIIETKNIYNRDKFNFYISNNDIITSNFFNSSNCRIGLMNFNYRNTLTNLNESHAGNYIDVIKYDLRFTVTPTTVRDGIVYFRNKTFLKYKNCFVFSIFKCFKEIWNMFSFFNTSIATISSWTTFEKFLCFEKCNEIQHFPCISHLNRNIYLENFAVVFKISPTQNGIFTNVDYKNYA